MDIHHLSGKLSFFLQSETPRLTMDFTDDTFPPDIPAPVVTSIIGNYSYLTSGNSRWHPAFAISNGFVIGKAGRTGGRDRVHGVPARASALRTAATGMTGCRFQRALQEQAV